MVKLQMHVYGHKNMFNCDADGDQATTLGILMNEIYCLNLLQRSICVQKEQSREFVIFVWIELDVDD